MVEEIDLSDYLGETILVRFQFVSDGAERRDGFYFDDLTIGVVEENTLNMNEVADNQFFLYPNPVIDLLTIETPFDAYTVDIFNIQGQRIFSEAYQSNRTQIDYSTFSSGMYLVRLTSESASKTFRVVKQ